MNIWQVFIDGVYSGAGKVGQKIWTRTHKHHFSATFSLKMGLTVLFTHLKIILLQCFQFSAFNCIQTDP